MLLQKTWFDAITESLTFSFIIQCVPMFSCFPSDYSIVTWAGLMWLAKASFVGLRKSDEECESYSKGGNFKAIAAEEMGTVGCPRGRFSRSFFHVLHSLDQEAHGSRGHWQSGGDRPAGPRCRHCSGVSESCPCLGTVFCSWRFEQRAPALGQVGHHNCQEEKELSAKLFSLFWIH